MSVSERTMRMMALLGWPALPLWVERRRLPGGGLTAWYLFSWLNENDGKL